jgi:hypothetical protein
MKVNQEPEKKLQFDPERCNKILEELMAVFQKHEPTVGETCVILGNLGYSLGASIGGYDGKGPSPEELKHLYYTEPSLAVAMMLNGLTVTTWYEDWVKIQLEKSKTNQGE